ncbi:hypothetical protein Tco_0453543, partial [Tanacetum coccineum]
LGNGSQTNQADHGKCHSEVSQKGRSWKGFLEEEGMLVLSDTEEEEPEVQGRKSQDDPLDSSVQGLVTLPYNKMSIDKEEILRRRKETKGKKVVSSLDFQEEVDAGAEQVNTASAEQVNTASAEQVSTAEGVNTGSIKLSTVGDHKGQREGKAPMISEETPKKSKEQILQEEASLAEAIRLDTLQKEEVAKQVHLDSLLAQRIAEEEELTEQQKKRKAQVQFKAQHYTNENWDLIRAKIEANAELSKSMLGSELQGERFCKEMVDLVKSKRKEGIKGTWKLSSAEKFNWVEKDLGAEELQTKDSKRLKDDEAKDDEPTKKYGKRRKQMARKGLHTSVDLNDSEDSDEVGEQEETVTTRRKKKESYYQIVREDGTDVVYINFGVMLKSISRDDLTELYRIVMNRYGMDGPEDKLEKGFWKCLRTMFEEPLSTDSIWSELGQQKIISWRYYDTCRVHCLNLESMDVYMLSERKYPLSAELFNLAIES